MKLPKWPTMPAQSAGHTPPAREGSVQSGVQRLGSDKSYQPQTPPPLGHEQVPIIQGQQRIQGSDA